MNTNANATAADYINRHYLGKPEGAEQDLLNNLRFASSLKDSREWKDFVSPEQVRQYAAELQGCAARMLEIAAVWEARAADPEIIRKTAEAKAEYEEMMAR